MSETLLAAMIGAAATIATALFQLFSSARNKADTRNNRRSLFRTTLSIAGLMAASAVGGYLYAELRADTTRRDVLAMRDEISAQLKAVASSTARIESLQSNHAQISPPVVQLAATAAPMQQIESVVHVPACRPESAEGTDNTACANAQRTPLCASLPTGAIIQDVQLFSRSENTAPDWNLHRIGFDQDSDGARFVDKPYEQTVSTDRKALCVNYAHTDSEQAHFARLVVQFRTQ